MLRRLGTSIFLFSYLSLFLPESAWASGRQSVRDLGRAAPSTIVRLAVRLAYRHEAELDSLISAQGDRHSPYFRRYLTSAQFDAYFSPDSGEVAAVRDVLQRAGFAVGIRAGRQTIDAAAPAPTVDRFFATQTHLIAPPGGGLRYASVLPSVIPPSLRGRVAVVDGFSNVPLLSSPVRNGVRPSPRKRQAFDVEPGLIGPDGGFGVLAEAQAYDFPVEHGFRGDGWSVATITGDDVKESDVATYLRQFHQTRTGTIENIAVDGGCYRPYRCDLVLPQADAESIIGVAPGASYLNYVVSSFYNATIEDAFDQIVAENRADVVNFSLAECETDDPQFSTWINAATKRGTVQGQTFVFASGGGQGGAFGAYGCQNGDYPLPRVPTAPSTGRYDLAVGGADVVVDGDRYISETGDLESGGGVSTIFPVTFQRGIEHVKLGGRNVPDTVAAASIDGRGPSLYVQGYTGWVGGFAAIVSAPLAGALVTIDQVQGRRSGHAVAQLYAQWQRRGNSENGKTLFRDIVAGCNGIAPAEPGFCALPGYDRVTGIGSIDAFHVAVAAGGTL